MPKPKKSKVSLRLSQDEALVLFDFLARFSEENTLSIDDKAEEQVLWDLGCAIEKQLVPPFRSSYAKILASARASVRAGAKA